MNAKPPPFCWQDKPTLRKIRELAPSPGSALAVYLALTEIASDKESDTFQTTHHYIGKVSGFSWRTVLERLKDLQRIGVIEVQTPRMKAPSTYRLLRASLRLGRSAIDAERSAKMEASSLQSYEERNREKKPSANGKGKSAPFKPALRALFQEELAKELNRG